MRDPESISKVKIRSLWTFSKVLPMSGVIRI